MAGGGTRETDTGWPCALWAGTVELRAWRFCEEQELVGWEQCEEDTDWLLSPTLVLCPRRWCCGSATRLCTPWVMVLGRGPRCLRSLSVLGAPARAAVWVSVSGR